MQYINPRMHGGEEGSAQAALAQIRERKYTSAFKDVMAGKTDYANPPLAVAIVWDPKTKVHECAIEKIQQPFAL